MVSAGDALPHRAHEEDRPLHARTPRTDPQLFPRSEAALQRSCRGPEQQSQSHHEKILRIPYLPLSRTCPLSLTWQITGAGINPRVFLTNQTFKGSDGLDYTTRFHGLTVAGLPCGNYKFILTRSDIKTDLGRIEGSVFLVDQHQCLTVNP